MEYRRVSTGGILCSHVHRAGPARKYADRGSRHRETRSHLPPTSRFLRRKVHNDPKESPITLPNTDRSLCHPIGAPGVYSLTRTCCKARKAKPEPVSTFSQSSRRNGGMGSAGNALC